FAQPALCSLFCALRMVVMKNCLGIDLAAVVFLFGMAAVASAQECSLAPKSVNLGQTLRLTCSSEVVSAKWHDRTIRMFPQPEGLFVGLLPVCVKDSPGPESIAFLAKDGSTRATLPFVIRPTKFPSENVRLSPDIEALHSTPEEIQLLTNFRNEVSDSRFWQ